MNFSYKTITKEYRIQLKEKGSSFMAYLFPVKTESDFKKRLNELKSEFHDASHHCYAFRLDKEGRISRASDDGEPSGTAGKPIMNQLLSAELSYCALVVVRYFGGIKLGTGGLIKAYKDSAKTVIDSAEIILEKEKAKYYIETPFELSGELMRLITKSEACILRKEAREKLIFHLTIPIENLEELKKLIHEMNGVKINHEPFH